MGEKGVIKLGKKLTAFLMSLIIILPLVAQAWATPQIAYAATGTTTIDSDEKNDQGAVLPANTASRSDNPTTEAADTNGSLGADNRKSNAINIQKQSDTSSVATLSPSENSASSDSTNLVTSELFFTGSVDANTTFMAGQKTQLNIKISNSGQNKPFKVLW